MTHRNEDALAGGASRQTESPWSTFGLWSAVLTIVVMAAESGAFIARVTGLLEHALLVAILGFGVGVLMGSPRTRPRQRGIVGLAVGFIGTVSGSIISVFLAASLDPEPVEVIPALVALVSNFLGMVAGGACAFGALVGGFLRGRFAEPTPIAQGGDQMPPEGEPDQ